MIQCVSDSNPYDEEPDPIEEAQAWLKRHSEVPYDPKTWGRSDVDSKPIHIIEADYARSVIEGLLELIKEETGLE